MATPHRGSHRVSSMVLNLVRRLVTLPIRLTRSFQDIVKQNPEAFRPEWYRATEGSVTAVDNTNPGQPFIRTLAASPIAPGVTANSIVAVQGSGPLSNRSDGVVAYESAHLTDVASEKIVQSSHSMQSHPDTVLEVRRILREHVSQK